MYFSHELKCSSKNETNYFAALKNCMRLQFRTWWSRNFKVNSYQFFLLIRGWKFGFEGLFWKTPRFLSLQKIFQSDNENRFISLKYWKIVHLYILVLNRNLVQCFKEKVKLQTHLNLLHLKCGLHYTHHWHHVYSAMTFDFVQFYLNR